jgi:Membrane carboxypeptidase (penicillin-binding protein)
MRAKKTFKVIVIVFLVSILFIILGGSAAFFIITSGVSLDDEKIIRPTAKAEIYDTDGEAVEYVSGANKYVEYSDISKCALDAFIAVEDKRFYNHRGIDYLRLGKSMLNNMKYGDFREGGSTITQQLAKNTMLTNEKTVQRKLKEAKLARLIEKKYSKEEIIAMYLNAIYFGNGIYGIERASSKLFGKEPSELTLPEAATLAGIVKNPAKNSPLVSPEKAHERMNLVLKIMRRENYISDAEMNEAEAYIYKAPPRSGENYSYAGAALEEAAGILKISEAKLVTEGYKIYTYRNSDLQAALDRAFASGEYVAGRADYSALVADNATGGIEAYAASFTGSIFNIRRQPGSALKPILVYAPALNSGYVAPETPVLDEKGDYNGYSPDNYGDSYAGWIDVRRAVAASSNSVAVKLMYELGTDYCKYSAARAGINLSDEGLSAALGGLRDGVTVPEMAGGYMTLASGGRYKRVSFVREIKSPDGRTIYTAKTVEKEAFSRESSYLLTQMLIDTAKYGTAKKLSSIPFQIAAKTGTAGYAGSEQNSDAWSMSYTSENTVAVWYGNLTGAPENRLDKSVTGGGYPTLLARFIYQNVEKPADFLRPEGITDVELDGYALKNAHILALAAENTPPSYKIKAALDANNLPSVSDAFDGVIPEDFLGDVIGGEAILSFTPKKGFIYKLKKENGGDIATAEGGEESLTLTDDDMNFGMNSYYLSVYTSDGVQVGESKRVQLISLNFFNLL